MTRIHANYDRLNDDERAFVDDIFSPLMWAKAKSRAISLAAEATISEPPTSDREYDWTNG